MPATLGAQRLYKAITKNDVPIVTLFLSSEKAGDFSYQKVFDLWVCSGRLPEMLDALMQHQPFHKWERGYHRRNKKNFDNTEFVFGYKVLNQLQLISSLSNPTTDNVLWMKAVTEVLASHEGDIPLNNCQFARHLGDALNEGKDWPWCIAAASRGIGMELATRSYSDKKGLAEEAIEWFRNVHGEVVEADIKTYEADFRRFMEVDRYRYIPLLVTNVELQKKLFAHNAYGFKTQVEGVLSGYKNYKKLVAIAPWLAQEGEGK